MGMGKGLSQTLIQTYTDRCTGATQVFSVPMNGQTVVAFYNRSKVFTSQDFQDGTLRAWLEETYLWWTSLSPCSTAQTGATATQQTPQQTTQQATQAASNAAASAASTAKVEVPVTPPAPTTPSTNAPPTNTSQPTTTETSTPPPTDTSTANSTAGTENTSAGGTDNASTGTDNSGTDTNQGSTSETQSSSEQSDTSSTETSQSTEETTSTDSSESSSTEDSSSETSSEDTSESSTEETSTEESTEDVEETTTEESTEESNESETEESTEESTEEETTEESTEEESTEEETTEEESTEEESENEESDEESSEEESDEESEEDTEEESEEEESEDDESEEDEEEDTEEESNDEDEEEDDKKKKKKRALAPPVVMANMLSQQGPDGSYTQAAMFGISQSSLLGTETYGVNAMVYSNLQQFMLTANYSKVHVNKEGRVNRVYSGSLGGMKMFTTYMGMMNHSVVWLGEKGSVKGLAFGTTLTSVELDVREGLIYYDNVLLGTSLTGFYTKPFNFDRLTISPMLAVSSPFFTFDLFEHTQIWNTDMMIIGGSSFTYKLTQRFGINFGVNIIEATIKDFPTLKTFTIGGRLSF